MAGSAEDPSLRPDDRAAAVPGRAAAGAPRPAPVRVRVHDAERDVVVAFDVLAAYVPPGGRRQRGAWNEGGLRGGAARVDLSRAAAQPQDLADRGRCAGDRAGPPARSSPG